MAIRFTKYIDITSAVGGASQVPTRLWVGRVFTTNPLVDALSVLQFGTSDDVLAFFGSASEEYKRAVEYFRYVSPIATKPKALQFARWVSADQPFVVNGESGVSVLATLQAITAGLLSFKFGATQINLTGIDLGAAASFADVATAVQTKLRANAAPEVATATVVWNATAQAFDITGSPTGVVTETVQVVVPSGAVPTTDVAAAMGLYASQGALITSAHVAEAPEACLSRVMSQNNNCGSFCFTDTAALTLTQVTAVANQAATYNVGFMYQVRINESTYSTWQAALIGIAGVGLNYQLSTIDSTAYLEMFPMSVQASIDFTKPNGTLGFMYKQDAALTPSVTTDTLSDSLDSLRINYIGQTQSAGALINFYQRGVLCGGTTSPLDMTIYANEQWFKDYVGSLLMSLQLSQPQVAANARGQTLCGLQLKAAIEKALVNGTISVNGPLDSVQQAFIYSVTNDPTAWQQVQSKGYWYTSQLTSAINAGVTEYTYQYTLLYRKDDVIKQVNGSHLLV